MTARIRSIGVATPDRSLAQDDLAAFAARTAGYDEPTRRRADALYRSTRVRYRAGVVLPARGETSGPLLRACGENDGNAVPTTGERLACFLEPAVELAARAGIEALRSAATDARSITHLVTVSCTGFAAPGVDLRLIDRLDLDPAVRRLNVGFMGCHGAINGLAAAHAFAAADSGARVALVAVELCSLHFSYEAVDEAMIANALFADGAAACIVATGDDGPRIDSFGSTVIPDTADRMGWTIGDHGFRMTLARDVPDRIRGAVGPWIRSWLEQSGLSVGDVAGWAVHPGGPGILQAVEDALVLSPEALAASRGILQRHGNLSSPTVLFVVDELIRSGTRGSIACVAFGPGLVAEAALLHA